MANVPNRNVSVTEESSEDTAPPMQSEAVSNAPNSAVSADQDATGQPEEHAPERTPAWFIVCLGMGLVLTALWLGFLIWIGAKLLDLV